MIEIRKKSGSSNPPMTLTMDSEVLQEERRIYLQLPDGFAQSRRSYPVLLVLDGEWLFELSRAHVQFYSEFDVMGVEIPKMIVVGIENQDRDRDYLPTKDSSEKPQFPTAGEAAKFLSFLRDELLPLLEAKYRATANRTLVGWSFGGLCALHAAVSLPDLFHAYLCIGPSVWWDDERISKQLSSAAFPRPTRMVITVGADENPGPVYDSTLRLLDALRRDPVENLQITTFEFEGVGHGGGVPLALSRGLRALFPQYRMQVTDETTLDMMESYYQRLSKAWGFDVIPTPWVLQTIASNHWAAGRHAKAIEALDWYIAKGDASESLIYAYKGIYSTKMGDRDTAVQALKTALHLELARDVPNGVYVRGYRARLADAERLSIARE